MRTANIHLALTVALALGMTAHGESTRTFNVNGSMELGSVGKPVPGWTMNIDRIGRKEAAANPGLMISAVTAPGGVNGQCLKVPVTRGLERYRLTFGDMFIDHDCEVEISFDYKMEPADKATPSNLSCGIDFRCLGDERPDYKPEKPDHPRYPVLKGFGFTPTTNWQHVERIFKAIKWNNCYALALDGKAKGGGEINAALLLDNFSLKIRGDKAEAARAEAAMVTEAPDANYFGGETVKATVRALLASEAASEELQVKLVSDNDGDVWKNLSVDMREIGRPGALGLYEGELSFLADKFGSFHAEAVWTGAPLPTLGDVEVLHPVVEHRRFTPGWTMGYNAGQLVAPYPRRETDFFDYVQLRPCQGSLNRKFSIPRLAGMSAVRHWGDWKTIEPEEGKFHRSLTDLAIDGYRDNGLDPLFCLAGDVGNCADSPNGPTTKAPRFLYQYRAWHSSSPSREKSPLLLPPLEVYGAYLDFCLKTWGKDIHMWEMFNEPGAIQMPADRYVEYLKFTYKKLKTFAPNDLLLGNGATSDLGQNVVGWCKDLNDADPNYPNYLDGVAFHPYSSSTDFARGVYGLYSIYVKSMSDTLKIKKPLWNTECFYITNARRPQVEFYVNKERCGANEVQRHYLDGLLNGVKLSTSLTDDNFLKSTPPAVGLPVMSESAVAANALSYLLKGMEKLEPVKLNKFMRAGIFTDATGGKAMGFVYDLRLAGSTMVTDQGVLGLFGGVDVTLMDLFGNELKNMGKIPLSYEPCYIKGATADVKAFFEKTKFIPNESCKVFARNFRDEVHLDALNATGMPCTLEAKFAAGGGLPNVQFVFADGQDDNTVPLGELKNAKLDGAEFKVVLDGEANGGAGKVALIPATPCHDLAPSEATAKELTLSMGSKAKVWSEGGALRVKVQVKDDKIVAAPRDALWEGDALEVFVDPFPFNSLDRDNILGSSPLPCLQYVFGALPAASGVSALGMDRANLKLRTKAICKQSKTSDGYVIDASIPWGELKPQGSPGDVIGLELEIDHHDGKDNIKESLNGKAKAPAYNYRLHYPLFKLDKATRGQLLGMSGLRNGDFRSGAYGDPDVWCLNAQNHDARATLEEGAGVGGGNALVFDVRKAAPCQGALMASQKLLKPEWAKAAKVGVRARLEKVDTHGKFIDGYWPQGFAVNVGGSDDYGRLRRELIAGDRPWTYMQYLAKLPAATKEFELSFGLRGGATGRCYVDYANVEFMQ